ncbi:uncharacterized protein LOC128990977 [Macrosteles quadrilineatus]|uniref:uncharacterized protein LOC128990977 n=1 Tax=Macrosteles quadrilineatus TaxID=74068 RepID=UPI0023E1DC48|nr:uncharacterized protein LOC128990977 [Macrosteles quadrilineatus]XP_054269641.1 uncharacterized protein LOC128990977 [Macrosteles quadrilineatus]
MWLAPILVLSLSLQASVGLLEGKGRIHPRNNTSTTVYPSKRKEAKQPATPFDFPSQDEIERLIREEGFFMAVLTKLIELFYGMLTAPFRWVFRVFELIVTILKLAAESFRQLKHPPNKRS